MLESTLDRIELQDVSGTWLRRLVRFAYLHRIHLNMGELYDAMATARMLQFNEVISRSVTMVTLFLGHRFWEDFPSSARI